MHCDFHSIPLFNLNDLEEDRAHFIRSLREVCHNVGFFYVKNHGISQSLMEKMLGQTTAFFELPQSEKESVSLCHSPHFRGYGKLMEEMTEGKLDFKESMDFGLEQPARKPQPQKPFLKLQGPNQWPTSSLLGDELKPTVLEYLREMQRLGERLMGAMSLTLGLKESTLAEKFSSASDDSFALLRLLRYPPSKDREASSFGVGPHVDSGCLVILLQDEVGGLQVQNRKGDWVDAPPIPGTFVVNIGYMLQIWSSNYFLATPHRVLNSSTRVRHSVPFFFEPSLTTEVKAIELPEELRTAQVSQTKTDAVIYGEHMWNVAQRSFSSKEESKLKSKNTPTVSFRALDRAMGTLSFFLQIQLPVFRQNLQDVWSILPSLYFSEMTIYHLDEINEDSVVGALNPEERFRTTLEILSRVLQENGLHDEKLQEIFAIGTAYWHSERQLCKKLNDGFLVTIGEGEQTLRKKSFDLAHMRHLLRIGLGTDQHVFDQIDRVLSSFDFWAEVLDDYHDYEKDERNKSFNIVRCFRANVPQPNLAEELASYAASALRVALNQTQFLEQDIQEHLQKHKETFMTPKSAIQKIIREPLDFKSPDADTKIYATAELSTPVFSFMHIKNAFELMKRISEDFFPPRGLSIANFICRERNKTFFLSSLLVSNWESLSQNTRRHGLLELEKQLIALPQTELFDELFVLQCLSCVRKCDDTTHNRMWCNHHNNKLML